jgi:tetratricopeptide (TPR) repeat protein
MSERTDVFISSTSRDLGKYRAKVKETILAQKMYPVAMEEFQPSRENALQTCYDAVQESEVFIGIYAHRYGYSPGDHHSYTTQAGETRQGDGETSITHLEYLWALEKGIPIFLFLLAERDEEGEPFPWPTLPDYVDDEPSKSRLKAFKQHIGDQYVVKFFTTPDDLAAKVATALSTLPREKQDVPLARRHDFFHRIDLPEKYVPRPGLLDELRAALLGDKAVAAVTSGVTYQPKEEPTALNGIGGIGKSVMARALCDDPTVQALFADGILWVTLGKEVTDADIDGKLREWVFALDGALAAGATTENVREELARLLRDKACLLIVDDVWSRKQAERFTVGGARCRVLLTTRDSEIARDLGADICKVPPMTEGEAVTLLEEWAKKGLDARRVEIFDRLGRLPLAIKLAGAQLQGAETGAWLATFDARKLKSRRREDPHDSLEQTFGMSLDALGAAERRLYNALTIFREDEDVPQQAVARLWLAWGALDAEASDTLIDDLAARALLETVGEQYPRAIKLHDLLRDFMEAELGAADTPKAHEALLKGYKGDAPAWHTLPDDGYLYTHLGYHLLQAGRRDELYALLTATHDWMDASHRELVGDHAYAADLELLIDTYADPLSPDALLELASLWTARQVVNARVGSYTDEDLEIMILIDLNIEKTGRRTAQVLNVARLRDGASNTVWTLLQIWWTLREAGKPRSELLGEAQALAGAIADVRSRANAFRGIAAALAQAGRFDEARQAATAIESDDYRAVALTDSAAALAKLEQFDEARQTATAIEDDHYRAEALSSIAVALAQVGRFDEARQTVTAIESDDYRAKALSSIAVALAQVGHFDEARQIATAIERDDYRTAAFREIAAAHAKTSNIAAIAVFDQVRQTTTAINVAQFYTKALHEIAAALARLGRFDEARQISNAIEDHHDRAVALTDITAALATLGQFDEACQAAAAIEDDYYRAEALCDIAATLAQTDDPAASIAFDQARQTATIVESHYARAAALRDLAAALANAGRMGGQGGAFGTLGLRDLNEYIESIANWHEAFERVQHGLTLRILRETLRIAAWAQPSWGEIAKMLEEDDPPAVA